MRSGAKLTHLAVSVNSAAPTRNFRYESKTVLSALKCDFRSIPINGHHPTGPVGPVGATTGLVRRSKSDLGQPVKWVWRIGLRAILPQAPSRL
jgi:hypothetical protein